MDREKILLRRLKAGDEHTFREIYVTYHKQLYSLAFKYLRVKELAEDAVHDVFVKLWDSRTKLEESGSLSGFLFTAVKNHVMNTILSHKRKLKKKIQLAYEERLDEGDPRNVIFLSEYKKIYQAAIEQLPEACREVFELRVKEGLTNDEVAEYLGISIHTVKSQFYKASKFIREFLDKRNNSDTGT